MLATLRLALLSLCTFRLFAQDPYRTAPGNYKLEFENDWVRVSRVSYRPGDKLAVHDHPALPTVYVYVTDGGPVLFGHQEFEPMRRPAVKAGQIRFNRGNKETHTTEYLGDTPSEYIRIELKTQRIDLPRRDIRIAADDATTFENGQLRIERQECSPCTAVSLPTVVITMADRRVHWVTEQPPSGRQIRITLKSKPLLSRGLGLPGCVRSTRGPRAA
jgi:hypothetical protein